MTTLPEEEVRFSRNATILAQAIHESVEKLYNAGYQTVNPFIIQLASNMIGSFDKHYLIQGFIDNSHQVCWDNIKKRDEIFFCENSRDIFKYLPINQVNLFKDLFLTKDQNGNPVIKQSLKDQIWNLLDMMVKICIKYVHKHRDPYSHVVDDQVVNAYRTEFKPDVDIEYHSSIWGVKLEFPADL